ncbi:heat-inducible transcriptional repressor HrcA [Immundisolibacter sp.]|uniref:heat-inducible transcriptional repressor HrcA n=1 Tax=Immundisolibacter sp. TaxID=1934948 RepID=UPI003565E1E6
MPASRNTSADDLNDRTLALLKGLVEHYVVDGRPVGSKTLARDLGLGLSSATLRNIMADLERLGLICAPHTSAGRVPTAKGLRVFIDNLIKVRPIDRAEEGKLRRGLGEGSHPDGLVEAASKLLAELSQQAGVVLLPRRQVACLRQVDFVTLSEGRLLVILVTDDGRVHNWVVEHPHNYGESELTRAANYLNENFVGHTLAQMRTAIVRELQRAQAEVGAVMATMVELANRLIPPPTDGAPSGDYLIRGESNLLANVNPAADLSKLQTLFRAFGEKRELLHLLDQCLQGQGVQIFLGAESGYQFLGDYSLVTAPYEMDGQIVGALGVIGPSRMPYERVVAVVDVTARLLGAALNRRLPAPS